METTGMGTVLSTNRAEGWEVLNAVGPMKHRLKYILVKTYWFFAAPIRRAYRYIIRPEARAVKVLIVHKGRVLLVRPTYGHRLWTVPGGAVDRGEAFEDAGRRETKEEVDIQLGLMTRIGEYTATVDYQVNTAQAFTTQVRDAHFKVDGIEIKEANWFFPEELPDDRVSRVDHILGLYRKHLNRSEALADSANGNYHSIHE